MSEDPEKPGRGRPRTMRRDDVLEVAMRAWWTQGPAAVSLNAICQRAGVSKPSVYREFGNEDGLTCAALGHYAQVVLSGVLEILSGAGGFRDRIMRVAHLMAVDPQHENGCLFVKMRAARDGLGAATQAALAQIEGMAIAAYAQALSEARASGEWSGTIPDDLAARYLAAQMGLALDMRARGEDPRQVLELALTVLGLPQD